MVVYANSSDMIHIGRVGENKATTVAFDVTDWIEEFGEGNTNLIVEKDGKIYPKNTFKLILENYEANNIICFSTDQPLYRLFFNSTTKPGYSFYFDANIETDALTNNCSVYINLSDIKTYKMAKIINNVDGRVYYKPINYIIGDEDFLSKGNFTKTEIINGVTVNVRYISLEEFLTELPPSEINKNFIFWEVIDSDTQEAGVGKCMLDYRVNDVVVKSKTYTYIVTNSIGEKETVEPEEYNWVELILDKANYIEDNIEGSHISATEAEAWAVGKKNGHSVTEDEEQYNNNAKYYSERSRSSANAAAHSANLAEDSEQTARLWAVGNETFDEEENDDGTSIENIDFETNNAKYFYEQAIQEKEKAENWAIEAEGYKDEAMAIAFGGQDVAEVVQGLINEGMNKSVTIYNWTSALLS